MDSIPIPTNLPPRKLQSNLSVQVDNLTSDDDFMMYEFKVQPCVRARSHDWTDCPLAHPGEKARRRDPRQFHYAGAVCPDYKSARGSVCPRGDSCEFAHGVFESWLHPAKYRTTQCRDGEKCTRKVCFFAHSKRQLRVVQSGCMFLSPTSTLVGHTEGWGRRRKGWLVEELMRRLEEMEIAPLAMGDDDGGGEPDFEWVDELLE